MYYLSRSRTLNVLATFSLVLVPSFVLADDTTSTQLGEIVVTANRVAKTVDETLVPVSIITRQDIEKYQATDLTEVLRRVPGLSITRNGGVGKTTSIFMRGSNSGHVLVLIDGVKHGSATLGSTSFQHIPLDQIERIEVVRGPRSSLYGSEAIGGVIQIFTRQSSANTDGFKPSFEVGFGSHNSYRGNVNLAGGNALNWFNVNASTNSTDGINARTTKLTDKDGYEQDSLSLNVGHKFANGAIAKFSALRSEAENEFDGFSADSLYNADSVQQVISANFSGDISERVNLRVQIGRSEDLSDNFQDGALTSVFNTKRNTASLLSDIAITNESSVLLGVDWQDDKVSGTTNYAESSRDNKALFASYLGQRSDTNYEASLRYDDNEQFGTHTTGSLAAGYTLSNNIRLKASYGTAFKAPSFNQLYFPSATFSNPDLDPETSKNIEFGVSANRGKGTWEFNLFQNEIDNLIDSPDFSTPVENISESRIRGLEAGHSLTLANWNLSTNLTFQEPKNLSGVNTGKILRRRPKRILNVDLGRDFGRWNVGTSVHAESQRFVDAGNTDKLPGYATLGLYTSYTISKNWDIGLKVNNVLDKDYETVKTYNQDGANGMLTISYSSR